MTRLSELCCVLALVCAARPSYGDAFDGGKPIDRIELQRAVLERHPEVRAAEARARAARAQVDSEGRLPPPEAMAQVWQVPLEKPYAIDRAGMIMLGVTQRFPAAGSLGAREEAKRSEAAAVEARITDSARAVARDAGHAWVEYAEASERRSLHTNHERVEQRIVSLARARHATGGSLAEAVRAEAELARTQSDLAGDAARERTARTQINVLLGRPTNAELGPPKTRAASLPTESVESLIARATTARSELKVAAAETAAMQKELDAARAESKIPAFALSALYFVPTPPMNAHAYGVNASIELPWLWGGAAAKARAQEAKASAAFASQKAARLPIELEVVTKHSEVTRAADRLRVLRRTALPAGKRSIEVASAGYESGGVPLAMVLEAQRMLVDIEMSVVEAQAALDHALVDLEAAVGGELPTRPLADSTEGEGAHHGNR